MNAQTGAGQAGTGYNRGASGVLIDAQRNRLHTGSFAFGGVTYFGSYDSWDPNLNRLRSANMDMGGPLALLPDGSTLKGSYGGTIGRRDADLNGGWNVPAEGWTSPTVDANGNIFVGTNTGLACLNQNDGTFKWTYTTGEKMVTQPVIGPGGTLYVASATGRIYAF